MLLPVGSKRMRLQTVVGGAVFAALLPMLAFAVIVTLLAARQESEAVRQGMQDTARALSIAVDREVAVAVTSLKALATAPSLQDGDFRAFRTQAMAFAASVEGWLSVVDATGQQRMNTLVPADQPLPRTDDVAWLNSVLNATPTFISGAVTGPVVRQPFAAISLRVATKAGPVALTLSISPDTLAALLKQQELQPGWIGVIADRGGIIIARTERTDLVGRQMTVNPDLPRGIVRARTHEGIDVYLAWRISPISGWLTGVAAPVGAIEGRSQTTALVLGAAAVALLLLGLMLSITFSRRLTRPMKAYAAALGAPDGEVARIPELPTGIEELETLVSALRTRMQRAKDAIDARAEAQLELQALYLDLETRVAERTKQLSSTEALSRALFANSPDLRSIIRATADGKLVFEDVNDPVLEAFGWQREDIIGRSVNDIYPGEAAAQAIAQMRDCLARGRPLSYTADRMVLGKRHWFETTLVPVGASEAGDGGEPLLVANSRDVTERMRFQEQLRQSQKMETIGQLTGGIAHDFNNLLSVIMASLELLRKRMPPSEARLLQYIDAAMDGTRRGASLTQRMLAFARRQDLRPDPVQLPALLDNISEMLKRTLGPMVPLDVRFPQGLPPVLVDANQLELALLNLVVNARDAMVRGGAITITARLCPSDPQGELAQRPEGYVLLSVSDPGEGMDEATLARAGEPFFTTKGIGKGTGLGLAMVHGLAAQSGGALRLRSRLGAGTTAEIWLPATRIEAGPPPQGESAGARPAGQQLSVLLVDDDNLVRLATAGLLEDMGHRVLDASSGHEALDILRSGDRVDIVVTDYAMPVMSGVQLAAEVARVRPSMPVLIVTGYAEISAKDAQHLVRIDKPFNQRQLAAGMAEAMEYKARPG